MEAARPGALSPVQDLTGFLAGVWSLERTIDDALSGNAGRFSGRCVLTPRGDGALDYEETGTLDLAGHTGPAFRRYVYRAADGGVLVVDHADGSAFVTFDLSAGAGRARHVCGADVYEGEMRIDGACAWTQTWRVTGPAKDYRMASRMTREAGTR